MMEIVQQGMLSTNSISVSGLPLKLPTAAEMQAVMTDAYIGRVIQYTGETDGDLVSGALYVVREDYV